MNDKPIGKKWEISGDSFVKDFWRGIKKFQGIIKGDDRWLLWLLCLRDVTAMLKVPEIHEKMCVGFKALYPLRADLGSIG